MSGRAWKPGDVAVVTWDDASPADKGMGRSDVRKLRGVRTEKGWAIQYALSHVRDDAVIEARPLVVIDPEDREQVERLRTELRARGIGPCAEKVDGDGIANALRSLPAPPKPEEPAGLGAVVEDAEGRRWVQTFAHDGDYTGWRLGDFAGRYKPWADITAVRVLSEGVRDADVR